MDDHHGILTERHRFIIGLLVVALGFCWLVVVPLLTDDNGDQLDTLVARSDARTQTFKQIQDNQARILTVLLAIRAEQRNGGR